MCTTSNPTQPDDATSTSHLNLKRILTHMLLYQEGGSEEAHKEKSMNEFKVRVLKIEAPEIGA